MIEFGAGVVVGAALTVVAFILSNVARIIVTTEKQRRK